MATIKIFLRSHNPEADYREGGPLYGFNEDAVTIDPAQEERAADLYRALGVARDDADYCIGVLVDGRWALVGLDMEGHQCAAEVEPGEIADLFRDLADADPTGITSAIVEAASGVIAPRDPVECGQSDAETAVADGADPAELAAGGPRAWETLVNARGRTWVLYAAGAPNHSAESWERYGLLWGASYTAAYTERARALAVS